MDEQDNAPSTGATSSTENPLSPIGRHALAPAANHGKRKVAILLGMHRSGTSLLSNIMHYLGCDMADESDAISDKNPKGFWERPEIVKLHDEILDLLDRKIGDPRHVLPFPAGWWRRKELQDVKQRLVAYVDQQLHTSTDLWGFKDPRTCRMLPLWKEILRAVDAEPIFIYAIRSPRSAAQSMAAKNPKARPLSVAESELMWLAYNYDVIRHVADHNPLIVDYDDWFQEPIVPAERLIRYLDIARDLPPYEISAIVEDIVSAQHRHQIEEVAKPRQTMARALYDALYACREQGLDRKVIGQIPFVDLVFRSIEPLVEQLSELPGLRNIARDSADIAEQLEARHAQVQSLKQKLIEAEDAASRQAEAFASDRANLDAEYAAHRETREQLSRTEARVAEAEERAATIVEARAMAEASEHGRKDIEQQLASALAALKSAEQARDKGTQDLEAATAQLTLNQKERAELEQTSARLAETLLSEQAEFETERATLASSRGELKSAHEEIALLKSGLARRQAEVASSTEVIENLKAVLTDRLMVAESPPHESSPLYLAQENDSGAPYGSAMALVDGLAGEVTLADGGTPPMIVEIEIDGEILAAALTRTAAALSADIVQRSPGMFAIPWSCLPSTASGREALLRVAGHETPFASIAIPDLLLSRRHPEDKADHDYRQWLLADGDFDGATRAAATRHLAAGTHWPLISIIVLPDARDPDRTARTVMSIVNQVYDNWECLSVAHATESIDARLKTIEASRLAETLASCNGTYTGFIAAGDVLAPDALLLMADAILAATQPVLAYSDEDEFDVTTMQRRNPLFKGAWDLDLLLHRDVAARLALVETRALRRAARGQVDQPGVYETMVGLAFTRHGGFVHVPHILYHKASDRVAGPPVDLPALRSALSEYAPQTEALLRDGKIEIRWPLPDPAPLTSLIVPTRDRVDLLRGCVDGLLRDTNYPALEIIVVDNDSVEQATHDYLRSIGHDPRVRIERWSGDFDYSAINNHAVSGAKGTIIGLVNNDLKVIDGEWLNEMVRNIVRTDVGIVGAKLLYADDTLQHAGVVTGIGTASHRYKGKPVTYGGHGGHLFATHELSAVTAACLLIRKSVWDEVDGLSADFPIAYNDIDLCLKVREAGYRILFEPKALLYHLESQSRGLDDGGKKKARLKADRARFEARWPASALDPFYNPNLALTSPNFELPMTPRIRKPWRGDDNQPSR
jgi:GT2 family glycosyltransferase